MKDDEFDEAIESINKFLLKAKLKCLDDFDRTLQRISKLPFWLSWRAPQIAEETLHWGPYWCKDYPDGQDTSPKSLCAYYLRLLRWKIFGGDR